MLIWMDSMEFAALYRRQRFASLAAEESTLMQRLQQVRIEMNECVPICCLPTEILAAIFTYARDPELLSQVCSRWRSIVMAYPELWTFTAVIGQSASWISYRAEKSGNAPLNIWLEDGEDEKLPSEFTAELCRHTDRFKNVVAELIPKNMRAFAKLFKRRWDRLENLTLTVPDPYVIPPLVDLPHSASSPSALQSLDMLRVLPKTWTDVSFFRNLRVLSLCADRIIASIAPPVASFIDALQNCHLLEQLHLLNAAPKPLSLDITEHPEAHQVAQLSRLKYVQLFMNREVDAAYLLAHLALPADLQLYLQVEDDRVVRDAPIGPLACLPRDCSNLDFIHALSDLTIDCSHTVTAAVDAKAVCTNVQDHPIGKHPLCYEVHTATYKSQGQIAAFRTTVRRLGPCFRHGVLRTLSFIITLKLLRSVKTEEWKDAFSSLHCLQEIRIEDITPSAQRNGHGSGRPEHPKRLLLALTASSPSSIVAPSLDVLDFMNVDPQSFASIDAEISACIQSRTSGRADEDTSFHVKINGSRWQASS
ncbi:hypothetical protein EIP91_012380 [Steccherinum ochraceum]|uniref:F-box domain-containing protein n=1 Tax=Steccherinum ochraceum TaxID=92696 RepID=A0A4R0RUI3_9APHY|nr:hypothetical protein EIP91_012380 [Steccherinum ochraceum]